MGPASSHRPRAPRKALRSSQGGIAAIFAAVSLVTLLSAVALSIDIGRLYFADRNLQRLADLAAIDAARVQSQCLGSAGLEQVAAEVTASLQRNGLPANTNVVILVGERSDGSDGLQSFTPSNPGEAANAVQVTLSRTSPARILPLFSGESRSTLTTRAAASSELVVSVGLQNVSVGTGSLKPEFYGAALRANLALGGSGGVLSGSEATVSLDRLVLDSREVTNELPDLTVPEQVSGLLSDLEARLNQTGDSAAAALVAAYAAALETGRPGVTLLPSEVLGLPVRGSYDGATTTVGALLDAIAGAVSNGDVIQLPNLCALLPLDELPTAQLLPALCDSTVEASVPQPSTISTSNTSTQVVDLDTSSDNAASTAGGLIRVRLKLVNPLNGQTLSLPLLAEARGARARVREVACARAGLPAHQVTVEASAPTVRFSMGESAGFNASFGAPTVNLGNLLDDVEPATLLTATLRDVLTGAGLGAVANNPLFAGLMGQSVTVRAGIDPFEVGSGDEDTFCMEGAAPYPITTQCNGQPATLGGVNADQAATDIEEGLGAVTLSVQLPPALPALLQGPVQTAVNQLTSELTASLTPALRLLSPQLVRIARAANISVGEAQVRLDKVQVSSPVVFAR